MQHTLQLRPQNLGLKSKYNRAVCHCHLSCSFTDISFVMLFSRSPPLALAATTACSDWVDKLVEKKLGDRLKPAWVDKFRGLDPNAPMKYKQIPRRQTLSGISFTNAVGDPPLTVREKLDVELLLENDVLNLLWFWPAKEILWTRRAI